MTWASPRPAGRPSRRHTGLAARLGLGRGTVRARFTALYVALFLLSGTALLALAAVVASGGSSESEAGPGNGNGAGPPVTTAQALGRIDQLEQRLAQAHHTQAQQILIGSASALAVMAVVSVGLGWLVAGRVLRPLRVMTAATRRITADSLHERLAIAGPGDEVKDLADTIDGLLGRLEGAFDAQRRFVANASHELRTPLTTMRASLDVALAKPGPVPETTAVLAARMRTGLDRMDRLLESLLVLARSRHGEFTDSGPLALGPLARTALAARAADIAAKGLTVRERPGGGPGGLDGLGGADGLGGPDGSDGLGGPSGAGGPDGADGIDDSVWVRGSQTLLRRVADNLIDNAITHTDRGGWIGVAVRAQEAEAGAPAEGAGGGVRGDGGGAVSLVVESGGGPVLDQRRVADLAQPFRRLGADRTGGGPGSGLGLSIVAAVTEAHHGTLDLRARPGGGLRVTVTLPRASAPAPTGHVPRTATGTDVRTDPDASPDAGAGPFPYPEPLTDIDGGMHTGPDHTGPDHTGPDHTGPSTGTGTGPDVAR